MRVILMANNDGSAPKAIEQQITDTSHTIFKAPETAADFVVTGSALIFIALVMSTIVKKIRKK